MIEKGLVGAVIVIGIIIALIISIDTRKSNK